MLSSSATFGKNAMKPCYSGLSSGGFGIIPGQREYALLTPFSWSHQGKSTLEISQSLFCLFFVGSSYRTNFSAVSLEHTFQIYGNLS